MAYPKDFVWGVATSSYQIEGAALEDGRGECIWTRFSHTPGKVKNDHHGDTANDHYHLYKEDVALIKSIGMGAYRFSISWPRVIALGTGAVNPLGLDFYDRLVDEQLKHGLTPYATLYHWDLPQALQDRGGWEHPDSPKWFADYAEVVAKKLGDRVKHWITHNEPWCTAFLGNLFGVHAPGKSDPNAAFKVAHHLLISHGMAIPIVRHYSPGSQAGITLNLTKTEPATFDPADKRLADRSNHLQNYFFLHPLYHGRYHPDTLEWFKEHMDGLDVTAVKGAATPTDFLGINYYMRWVVKHDPQNPERTINAFAPNAELTDMGWEVYPEGLSEMLEWVHKEYAPPAIFITENGCAYPEPSTVVTEVLNDPKRVAFFKGYLAAAEKALHRGVPLKGYFAWSLMDNFEWAEGYWKRFGIVHVDFETQKRTLKQSALYLKGVAETGVI
jgi:beta-glucosidase